MERFEHTPEWQPRPGKAWYAYWELSPRCRHLQRYPEAWRPATPVDEKDFRSCKNCYSSFKRNGCGKAWFKDT